MSSRERKSAEARKSEIVETTLLLADNVGPDRLSTADIARKVGITQAAIFRHFPKKQDLWEAVALRIGEKYRREWLAAEKRSSDPLGETVELVTAQLRLIERTPAIPAILFSRELHAENGLLRQILSKVMMEFHGRVMRALAAAQEAGRLRRDLDPSDLAFLVIGLAQGLVLRWSLSGRAFALADEGRRLLDIQLALFGEAGADTPGRSAAVQPGSTP